MPAGDININAQFEDDANAPLKNPPQITAFVVNGVSAVINSDTKAITIILPYGTDLRHVAPTIVTANASKVEPSSAQRVDLSTPKAYQGLRLQRRVCDLHRHRVHRGAVAHAVALGEAAEPDQQQPQLVGAGGVPEKDRLL